MGINKFSDMTHEEFSAMYGVGGVLVRKREGTKKSRPLLRDEAAPLPEIVDWHAAGKMTIPADQGGCGSCWAFTTAATIETAYAIKTNSTPEKLSVQYLIDCDTVNFGCGGGWMLDAYDFTKKHGIIKEDEYKSHYAGRKEKCSDPANIKERINNDDESEEDSISVQRLKELLVKEPMGAAFHSNPKCLMGYKTGVIREEDCKCSFEATATVNHAVTVVGYGKNTQNNQDECPEYFKIRNSWGPNWGEEGYFKVCIPKDEKKLPTGTCQVLSYIQYPLFK
jgi:C1A family cysteine protease